MCLGNAAFLGGEVVFDIGMDLFALHQYIEVEPAVVAVLLCGEVRQVGEGYFVGEIDIVRGDPVEDTVIVEMLEDTDEPGRGSQSHTQFQCGDPPDGIFNILVLQHPSAQGEPVPFRRPGS